MKGSCEYCDAFPDLPCIIHARDTAPEKHLHWMVRGEDKVFRCQTKGCEERRDRNGKAITPAGPPVRGHLKLVSLKIGLG